VSPNKKTFEKLMEKLGIEKGRYNGFVVTDSFEVMEMKRNIDGYLMYRDFQKAKEVTKELKQHLDMNIAENKWVIEAYEVIAAKYLREMSYQETLERLKGLAKNIYNFDEKTFSHIPMRNEVLLINNICITLSEMGQEQESTEIYRLTIQKIKSSKVKVKHRYRSYAILLNNYMNRDREKYRNSYEGIQNELLCGKAMEIPFCLNNTLHILEKKGISKEESEKWAKAIYYMSDLFYFKKEKEIYRDYIRKQCMMNLLE
ncbi:MAG: hypothetical protein K2M91_16135, partial [Lachnospiraceae bacterium]|nr:hypothetical protein [Lachnospiraceae bacterium]